MVGQNLSSKASSGDDAVVPVIDISDFLTRSASADGVVDAVSAACERVGFVVITGHGVSADLIDRMYGITRDFFALPVDVKQRWSSSNGNHYRGYASLNSFPSDDGTRDVAEGFEIARFDDAASVLAAGYGPEWAEGYEANVWPEAPFAFQSIWREYYAAMECLAVKLMELFAAALDLPSDWFADKFDRHTSYMSANLYPAQLVAPPDGAIRRGAHTDIGSLTILYQDGAPGGLQVLDRGDRWCDVPAVPGSYVINLGDLLAKWTNDRWVATQHRVINPPREYATTQRISIPFFQHPNFDALIECIPSCASPDSPPKYVPVLGGNWSKYRMAAYAV